MPIAANGEGPASTSRAAVESERDAAQAGEARAVEALTHGRSLAQKVVGETWDLVGSFTDKEQALFDWVEDLDWPRYPTPALDWLAEQRREAAAEENDRWADGWWDMKEDMTPSDFYARAAALRAGEVGHE